MARKASAPTSLGFGPPLGVRTTTEPYDDAALGDYAQDAANVYFRDPTLLSGAQYRPGFATVRPSTGNVALWQGLHEITLANGTIVNLVVQAGKIYRLSGAGSFSTAIDVTPVTPVIDTSAKVGLATLGDSIVVTDSINTPWVGTNLTSTPITGTVIPINSAGDAWSAFGPPTVYQGSVVFITNTTPAGSDAQPRRSIVYCEPELPLIGYTQSGFSDFANLIEEDGNLLYAILGTNVGLYYWRLESIGFLSGPLFSFTTTPTADAVSMSVGTTAPFSVQIFGQNIFFADAFARAWMLPLRGSPQPIWKQMASLIPQQLAMVGLPSILTNAYGAIVPDLNLYALAAYEVQVAESGGGSASAPPNTLFWFDGLTGNYCGRLNVGVGGLDSSNAPISMNVDVIGQLRDAFGVPVFVALGAWWDVGPTLTATLLASLKYVMAVSPASKTWNDTNTGALFSPGSVAPAISITSSRLGYLAGVVYNADLGEVITMSPDPFTVSVQTPYVANAIEVTAVTPNASQDGTYRTPLGFDICAARGMQFTIAPTAATQQGGFQRIEVSVSASKAGPEDQ